MYTSLLPPPTPSLFPTGAFVFPAINTLQYYLVTLSQAYKAIQHNGGDQKLKRPLGIADRAMTSIRLRLEFADLQPRLTRLIDDAITNWATRTAAARELVSTTAFRDYEATRIQPVVQPNQLDDLLKLLTPPSGSLAVPSFRDVPQMLTYLQGRHTDLTRKYRDTRDRDLVVRAKRIPYGLAMFTLNGVDLFNGGPPNRYAEASVISGMAVLLAS